jgi:flagellar hook assembly protein FlgD
VNSFPLATPYSIFNISVTWDGTNKNGEELPGGIYFIKVSAGETILSKKLLFVR